MGKITRIAEGAPQELVDLAREEMFGDYEHVPARYDYAPSEAAQPAMSLEIVLQRLQDNKINAGLQSFCFCGLTVWIGDPITRKMIESSLGDTECIAHLVLTPAIYPAMQAGSTRSARM